MSYHPNSDPRGASYPTTYAIETIAKQPMVPYHPLSSAEMARSENETMVKVVVGILVVIIAIAIAYWLWQQSRGTKSVTPNRRPASKQSTREMARALFNRLEERGGVNETTMRSLQQLGRR